MASLSLSWTIGLGLPAVVVQAASVALAKALRDYSRSRLEEVCEARGRPHRADEIAKHDVRTERAAESIAVLSSLILASLAGGIAAQVEPRSTAELVVASILGVAAISYVAAGALGSVFAERLLDRAWPMARGLRTLALPLTSIGQAAEWLARAAWGREVSAPRPASVEVEIPPDEDHPESAEDDLPEVTRDMLERVVELSRRDVSELMVPRSSMVMRPASISAGEAATTFRSTGLSRVPLYGENRDDVVGVLYAKDLFPAMLDAESPGSVLPRRLVRPAYFIPESKMAGELLEELRSKRIQIAVVLDEYGGVSGLITLEDLIEELVGEIDDEHDAPTAGDPVRSLGGTTYEVEASLSLEDLNERLGLHLATDGEVTTVGGFAFHALGRLPTPGASFSANGVRFTDMEVVDRSIRRMKIDVGGRE